MWTRCTAWPHALEGSWRCPYKSVQSAPARIGDARYASHVGAAEKPPGDNTVPGVPDPGRIVDRSDFAVELTLARERAGKTVRALAGEVDQPAATIGGYLSGQHLPPVKQTDLFRRILGCLGITGDEEVERWMEALARVRRKPGPRPGGAPAPYRGLESFGVEDAEWFFGRESLTEALIAKLADCVDDPRSGSMVMVVGPSGSGKSSLLRAGVVPAVLRGILERGSGWRCLMLTPGNEPVRGLAEKLAQATGAEAGELEAGLRSDTLEWPAPAGEGGSLVVVVDQFEEVFTLCANEAERQAFIAALRRLSRAEISRRGHVVVLLGLRADFYGRAAREPALVPVLQDHQVLVGPMTAEQLRRAITEPARLAGFAVDAELADLSSASSFPGARHRDCMTQVRCRCCRTPCWKRSIFPGGAASPSPTTYRPVVSAVPSAKLRSVSSPSWHPPSKRWPAASSFAWSMSTTTGWSPAGE